MSPLARAEERQVMIDLLGVEPHHRVVDVPAWAGYLADGITNIADPKQIMCVEPSTRFAAAIPEKYTRHCTSQLTIPTDDATIDRLGSMVLRWKFESLGDMARFARGLLGLSKATDEQTLVAIRGDVAAQMAVPCEVLLPWGLAYAVGVRSGSRERS